MLMQTSHMNNQAERSSQNRSHILETVRPRNASEHSTSKGSLLCCFPITEEKHNPTHPTLMCFRELTL